MAMRWSKWLTVVTAIGAGASIDTAEAAPASFIPAGSAADAPAGFVEMCVRDRVLCRAGLPGPAIVTIASAPATAPGDCGPMAADQIDYAFGPKLSMIAPILTRSAGVWSDDERSATINCPPGEPALPPAAALISAPIPVIGLPMADSSTAGTAALERPSSSLSRRDVKYAVTAIAPGSIDDQRLIHIINSQVNRQVVAVSDSVSRGVEEEWDRPGRIGRPAGDCEDYAIEKRMRLLEAGFAADRMFFAVVYRPNFGLHTVLVVRMTDGDYVLDSARAEILPWSKVNYVWLRVQSNKNPMLWTRLGGPAPAKS